MVNLEWTVQRFKLMLFVPNPSPWKGIDHVVRRSWNGSYQKPTSEMERVGEGRPHRFFLMTAASHLFAIDERDQEGHASTDVLCPESYANSCPSTAVLGGQNLSLPARQLLCKAVDNLPSRQAETLRAHHWCTWAIFCLTFWLTPDFVAGIHRTVVSCWFFNVCSSLQFKWVNFSPGTKWY
jgi:hypothetical protein